MWRANQVVRLAASPFADIDLHDFAAFQVAFTGPLPT